MLYLLLRHSPWVSALALGLVLLAAGTFTLVRALDVRDQIRDELRDEQIVTSQDARIPGVLVQDAKTAKAQADVIKQHTLGTWGPFSQLPRDDPRRAQFIDGVALRTALNLAVMGFGITDLLLGLGAILLVAGAATVALATPALYFLAGMVVKRPQAQG
ncbi:MAG TPA: hypothetical protein VNL95_10020 [Dehalococcoidia bacterium]|nr:hypothetical protein [Dehalococcoidia bacterium]